MYIGILQFELLIHDPESLKDKRRVVRSVKDRLHREHMVSVAETAALSDPSVAVLGLAIVSNSRAHIGTVMDKIVHKLRGLHDAVLGAVARDVLRGDRVEGEEWDAETVPDASAAEAEPRAAHDAPTPEGPTPRRRQTERGRT